MGNIKQSWETHTFIYLPSTWPDRNNKQLYVGVCVCVCVCVWSERTPATDSGRADASFDDWRLKRLFWVLWGGEWPPDWCMNIITWIKTLLCTHPHSIFQMDFTSTAVAVSTQPYYVWCRRASQSKKSRWNRKRDWADSGGRLRGDELTRMFQRKRC